MKTFIKFIGIIILAIVVVSCDKQEDDYQSLRSDISQFANHGYYDIDTTYVLKIVHTYYDSKIYGEGGGFRYYAIGTANGPKGGNITVYDVTARLSNGKLIKFTIPESSDEKLIGKRG